MRTCKEISEMVSKGMDTKLPFMERAQVRFHLFMCEACHRVETQFDIIKSTASKLGRASEDDDGPGEVKLSDEAKERICDKIKTDIN